MFTLSCGKKKEKEKKMIGWGNSKHGQLGNGLSGIVRQPTELPFWNTKQIISFCLGGDHTLVHTTDGLYSMGRNWDFELGVPETEKRTEHLITFVKSSDVVLFACGEHFNYVLTSRGLLSFGENNSGQLSRETNPDIFDENCLIDFQDYASIQQIALGASHALVLCKSGLFACGLNANGELGFSHFENVHRLTRMPDFCDHADILKLSCGYYFSLALTQNALWSWGENDSAQLGRPSTSQNPIQRVKFFDEIPILDIFAGGLSSLVLTVNGLYGFGSSESGTLLTKNKRVIEPTLLSPEFRDPNQIVQFVGTETTTYILTQAALYSFGTNGHGQIGVETASVDCVTKMKVMDNRDLELELQGASNIILKRRAEILMILLWVRTFDKKSPFHKDYLPLDLFKMITQAHLYLGTYLPSREKH